jgi:hypothetical protein
VAEIGVIMCSRTIKIYGITILLSILIFGCGNKNPEEISSMIRVSYPASQEVPVGLGVEIELTNESKYCVIFPQVTGMTIYTMRDGKEIEVNNLIVIMGNENMPLGPKDEIFSKRSIGVVPDTSNLSITSPTQFFVRLNGYLCDDESVKIAKVILFTVVP